MKKPVLFAAMVAGLITGSAAVLWAEGWRVDEPLRYQLAYIPDGQVAAEATTPVASLKLSPDFMPDIDNIILANIKGLGFTLPDRPQPENYKLYLKLFDFPEALDAASICGPLLSAYHIADMPGDGPRLLRYCSQNQHVAVKFGSIDAKDKVFTADAPFPALMCGQGAAFSSAFAKHILFSSLYLASELPVQAKTEDELARASAQGVVAFHKQLLAHYQKSLKAVSGTEPDKYFYFRDPKQGSTFKLPKAPMVFVNWRELPMPTDPKRHFLSGLLLIYLTQEHDGRLAKDTVFEVGSVVRLEK